MPLRTVFAETVTFNEVLAVILSVILSTSIKPLYLTVNKECNSERYLCNIPQDNHKNNIIVLRVNPTIVCLQGVCNGSCTLLLPNGEYSKASQAKVSAGISGQGVIPDTPFVIH